MGARPRTASRCPTPPSILSRKRWLAERDALAGRNAPLGLHLDAGERIDDIAADLPRFALIALGFPKFSDGRAFSTARLLREKHGYTGELRAVGNVLSDQIPLMRRVGFDAFEVTHAPTRRALIEGRIAEVALHYQPAAPTEPPAPARARGCAALSRAALCRRAASRAACLSRRRWRCRWRAPAAARPARRCRSAPPAT